VVEFLARDSRAERLAVEHVDDGTGHCRSCSAGAQAGRQNWPCSLFGYAARARDVARRRAVPPR